MENNSKNVTQVMRQENYGNKLSSSLLMLKNLNVFCDVTLVVEGRKIEAHKVVLIAISEYFSAMFLGGFSEMNKREIVIQGVSYEALTKIIDFIYTGTITIKNKHDYTEIEDLLMGSNILHFREITDVCVELLEKCLSDETCLRIYSLANTYDYKDLMEKAYRYISYNMYNLLDKLDFSSISLPDIKRWLSDEDLNITAEDAAADIIIGWLNDNPDKHEHALDLLSCIKIPLLSNDAKISLLTHSAIENDRECVIRLSDKGEVFPRKSTSGRIVAVGAEYDIVNYQYVEEYDSRHDSWRVLSKRYDSRAWFSVVSLNDVVYIIGGANIDTNSTNSVLSYNVTTGIWKEVAPMLTPKYYCSAVVVNGTIYVLGGRTTQEILKNVERWKPGNKKWESVKSMSTPKYSFGVAELNGEIYSVGGVYVIKKYFTRYNTRITYLTNVETYNVKTNKWSKRAPLPSDRGYNSAISNRGFVYSIGGYSNKDMFTNTRDVFRYDPKYDSWNIVRSTIHPRSNCGTCVLRNEIYVVGGYGNKNYTRVEKYNDSTDKWKQIKDTNMYKFGSCVCVIYDSYNRPSNKKEEEEEEEEETKTRRKRR